MNRMNLTAAILLAALSTPALAEDQPVELSAVPPQQVELIEQALEDINASRAMTPEEMERFGINDLVRQIEEQWVDPGQVEAKPREFVRGPFLGVNAKPLDIDTAKGLGLKRSTGLLVTYAPGNGPAGTAGLKKGDVLIKLNDQTLINAEQFAVLVRSQAIGDTVTLHGLRDGEPIKLEAKLGEADVSPLGPGGKDLDQAWRVQLNPIQAPAGNPLRPEVEIAPGLWIGDGWGDARIKMLDEAALPEEMREMIKKIEQQMVQQRQDIDKRMEQLRQQLDLDINDLRAEVQVEPGKKIQAAAITMMQSDDQHTIQIKIQNNERHATIKQRDGQVLFDDLLPEDGQVDGLPEGVQHKLDRMLKNTRIKIQQNQPAPAEQPEQREQQVS